MTLYLDSPTQKDLLEVLDWRKTCRHTLRTPRDITLTEQDAFYRDVVCDPHSRHRYYAVRELGGDCEKFKCTGDFVALVALENISWENGHAELGLIVDPALQGKGIGRQAVALALSEAFDRMRLLTVWLECYFCGHAEFWLNILKAYSGTHVIWPRRKFWGGALHDAILG